MGNCCKKDKQPARDLTLAILGLDNAGKTVTATGLAGEALDTVAPTVGFSKVDFQHGKHNIAMFDLGGGKKFRDIWNKYFCEIYGVIFVVDASDVARIEECTKVLHDLVEHPQIAGKPILLLANKQDVKGAMDDIDIVQAIGLEDLVNINKCPCRVETCAASIKKGNNIDPSISDSFTWLINNILKNYEKLNERVKREMEEKSERQKRENKARAERVRQLREEREREGGATIEAETAHTVDTGNPFLPVSVSELEAKEKRLKEEKKHKKSHEIQHSEDSPYRSSRYKSPGPVNNYSDDERYGNRTQTSRSLDGGSSAMDRILRNEIRGDPTTLTSVSMQQARELDRRKGNRRSELMDDSESGAESYDERKMGTTSRLGRESSENSPQPLPWNKPAHLRSLDTSALALSPRANLSSDPLASHSRRGLMPLAPLAPLDSGTLDKKNKKKKKHKSRFNQTEPVTDEDVATDDGTPKRNGLHTGFSPPRPGHGYSPPPQHRNIMKSQNSHLPKLEPLKEPTDSFSKKWGLQGLDEESQDDVPDGRRSRPNTEYDSDIMT